MSQRFCQEFRMEDKMEPASVRIRTGNGTRLNMAGQVRLKFELNDIEIEHIF